MACARYKDWLSDAALGALDPARDAELRAHVAECAACRAALEAERALFAAIDAGLEAGVAPEPSPEFAARVRMRVAEEPPPRPGWLTGWLPATAAALAVLVLLVVWYFPHGAQQRSPAVAPPAVAKQLPPLPAEPTHVGSVPGSRRTAVERQVAAAALAGGPAVAKNEPEVLVPPGQWLAVSRLYRSVQQGRVNPESLLRPLPEVLPAIEDLKVQELKIPAIEINGHSGSREKTEGESGKEARN